MSENKPSTVKKRLGQRLSVKNQIIPQPASDGKLKYHNVAGCSGQTPLLSSKKVEEKAMSAPRDFGASSFRAKLKRRKLEFVNYTQPDQAEDTTCQVSELTDDELIERIAEKQNQLEIATEHKRKVDELLESTAIWEEAFKRALDDLSEKCNQTKEDLLDAMKITPEIASLID